jgi:hypothetical protein
MVSMRSERRGLGDANVRSTSSAKRGGDQTARAVLRAAEQVKDGFDAE